MRPLMDRALKERVIGAAVLVVFAVLVVPVFLDGPATEAEIIMLQRDLKLVEADRFVGRGGLKLEGAIVASGVAVAARTASPRLRFHRGRFQVASPGLV